jgi:hypothetical protein
MVIEHADFEGIERLALVLGGEIVSTFEEPDKVKLGACKVGFFFSLSSAQIPFSAAVLNPFFVLLYICSRSRRS